MQKRIKRYFEGEDTIDGAGVKLKRTFGKNEIPDFDPFLMMDFFDSQNPDDYKSGFPWHPHRGIETVTYIINGEIKHGDSLDNEGVIKDGECQWMTAGSGIIHQEMPQPKPLVLGVQIWINLKKSEKMCDPKYRDFTSDKIPLFLNSSEEVKIIAGTYKNLTGPLDVKQSKVTFLDIFLKSESEFSLKVAKQLNAYAYLIRGQAIFDYNDNTLINYPKGILYEDGELIKVKTKKNTARFLLLAGERINEPVAWGGPIVMNTKEELDLAFRELKLGTFVKFK